VCVAGKNSRGDVLMHSHHTKQVKDPAVPEWARTQGS
jgi:hypothetical protein